MSKFFKSMITLLVIAGFVAPAISFADDRFSMSGYYTLRGFIKDNADYNDDENDSSEYFFQRLRVGTTVAVAEGVSVYFRADMFDGDYAGAANDQNDSSFDVDKGYVTIDKDLFTLTVGQNSSGFGNSILVDSDFDTQVKVGLKSVPLTLIYQKVAENDMVAADDQDYFAGIYDFKNDSFSASFFLGYLTTHGSDADRMAVGVAGDLGLGAVNLAYELDYLDGETEAGDDEKGINVYLNASMNINEAARLGAKFTYAPGEDTDVQIHALYGEDFSPENDGFMGTLYGVYPGDTFDPSDEGAGVIGIQPYVDYKVNDSLALHAHVAYATAEDDDIADFDILTYAASARYAFAANTNFDVAASYSDADANGADDARTTYACRLTVSF